MIRPPPRSTRTDTLLPYPTLFRSRAFTASYRKGLCVRLVYDMPDRHRGTPAELRQSFHIDAGNSPLMAKRMLSIAAGLVIAAALCGSVFLPNRSDRPVRDVEARVTPALAGVRSEERRVGKEGVRTVNTRWWPVHKKKK